MVSIVNMFINMKFLVFKVGLIITLCSFPVEIVGPQPEPTNTTTSTTARSTSWTTTPTETPTTTQTTTPTTQWTTSTSTIPPTPTRKPPKPDRGRWMVEFAGENYACIFLEMAASIDFYYINVWDEIEKGELNIPINATSIGDCGDIGRHKQVIKLLWSYGSNFVNALEFTLRKNYHIYEINKIVVNIALDPRSFPTAKDSNKVLILVNKNNHFLTPEEMSYKCDKEHILPLHHAKNHVDIGHLKIRNIYLQAFSNITNQNFAKGVDCKPRNQTSNLLFILTGGAIIGAIVATIVIYILNKRRRRPHGYLSIIGVPQGNPENIKNCRLISNSQVY